MFVPNWCNLSSPCTSEIGVKWITPFLCGNWNQCRRLSLHGVVIKYSGKYSGCLAYHSNIFVSKLRQLLAALLSDLRRHFWMIHKIMHFWIPYLGRECYMLAACSFASLLKLAILLATAKGSLLHWHGWDVSYLWEVGFQCLSWDNGIGIEGFQLSASKILKDKDWPALQSIASKFAKQTDDIYNGCIGALDGLALRVKCFTTMEVPEPGNFYCCQGFYALNVQCDWKKRFLWCLTGHEGWTYDSKAFFETKLYDFLENMA